MRLLDILSLSFRTIRSNKLRTGITVAIIAFGIMALVGINTAIDAMKQKFTESFASMGSNGFTIHYKDFQFFGNNDQVTKEKKGAKKDKKSNNKIPITKEQAELFKQSYHFPSKVSLSLRGGNSNIVSLGSSKTNPTVQVIGGDEDYAELNGYTLNEGRSLNELDVESGRNVCIIGSDIVTKFFGGNPERAVEKIIKINGLPFRIVGTMESKGSSIGRSFDNVIITSYNNVRRFFISGSVNMFNPTPSFNIQVKVPDVNQVSLAIGEAEGVFRPIRRINTTDASNFVIDKSDRFVEELLSNLSLITICAVVIGAITLLGAAVGLMNIMLVSVTERTKEIGLVKAIGGRKGSIRMQFLYESIMISLLGAVFGSFLGILIGNVFSLVLNTGFVFPWIWLFLGMAICTGVGILAGIYPSLKASRLNPIQALRYE
ncbi:MAG TPA: ABC transporter permease [Puia sp.]|jgi:putative ABC transport system permease protein|nr:ABC transporter permease [Puia sp.]